MLKISALVVLSTLVAGASAQEATPDTWIAEAKSVVSRTDVRDEAARMQASGELARLENPGYLPVSTASRPREEVVVELEEARASGELAAFNAEAFDFGFIPRLVAGRWLARRD